MKKNSILDNFKALDSLFKTVETFKIDFSKCGKHMKEARKLFNIKPFTYSEDNIKCLYGLQKETFKNKASQGSKTVTIACLDYFTEGKTVLIYNSDHKIYEFNQIDANNGNTLVLSNDLQHDYPQGSNIIAIREIEYIITPILKTLKRRVDRGRFQPLTRNVTSIYIYHFIGMNSVSYHLEVNHVVKIGGWLCLFEMV